VVARFIQNQTGNHCAISIDALTGQDPVLYFAQESIARWMLRSDASQENKFKIRDSTNNTRLTITQDGDIGIGTTSPNYKLDVRGSIGNNTTLYHSDRRWKKNIKPLSESLSIICQLRGVQFQWKNDDYKEMNFPDGMKIGFIAQEVENVLPDLVHTGVDGYKSVEYANVTPVLVEAIKELKAENDDLKLENKNIKAQMVHLTTLVETVLAKMKTDDNTKLASSK
jgi:endosialidase-like protein